MKQQFHLLILFLGISPALFGQLSLEKLDYSSYKPSDQRYRTIDYGLINYLSVNDNLKDLTNGNLLSVRTKTFRNTAKRQVENDFEVGLNSVGSTNGLVLAANFLHQQRNYLFKNKSQFFIPVNGSISVNTNAGTYNVIGHSLGTGLGFGRISVINEVAIAEQILSNLESEGLNEANIIDADVFELADFITILKNKRFVTNRGEWKSELEQIKRKLEELGYVDRNSSNEQLDRILTDQYRAEPLVSRTSGSRWVALATTSGVNYDSYILNRGRTNLNSGIFSLNYQNNNYLNSKLQLNTDIDFAYRIVDEKQYPFTPEILSKNYEQWSIGGQAALHYLPNPNTRFSTTLNVNYFKNVDGNTNKDLSGFLYNLNLEYEKRFKRNLRVAVGCGIGYTKDFGMELTPTISLRF